MIVRIAGIALIAALALTLGCSGKEGAEQSQGGPRQEAGSAGEDPVTQELKQPLEEPPAKADDRTQPTEGETEGSDAKTDDEGVKDANMEDKTEKEAASLLPAGLKPGLYAVMETTKGNIILKLFEDDAPKTVENFVGLATGAKAYVDPQTRKETKGKFYDGLIFHRVIPKFMIQWGCPLGRGTGGPGYKFEDEFVDHLKFDGPGYLAMANSGPNTNGSQFFITVAATDWLNNKHTIFGKIVEGLDVLDAISKVKRNPMDKPLTPVVVKHVTIERVE